MKISPGGRCMVPPKVLSWVCAMLSKTLTLFYENLKIPYTFSEQNTWFPYTISEQNRWFFFSHFTPEEFFYLSRDPVYTEHKPLYSLSGLNELQSQRVQIPSLFYYGYVRVPPLEIYSRMVLHVPLIDWLRNWRVIKFDHHSRFLVCT